MSKQILLFLFILTNLSLSKELTFAEKVNASFLLSIQKGINDMVEIQKKQSGTIEEFQKEQKLEKENWKDREIKRLQKSVKTISAERYKYIHLYSQEKDKNRELKKRIIELEKFIAQYHIKKDNETLARAKAKKELKRQLRNSIK